jgi:cation diffusion facilitator family transporter
VIALWILNVAAQPPDEEHMFGHGKVEYFSSGIEGALIFLAAISIGYAAIDRLFYPHEIEQIGIGLAISLIATGVNFYVARVLIRAGRRNHSIVLEADGRHLMTDVWTSVGVVIGVGAVSVTGWLPLDPIVAILVALNILWSGWSLAKRSVLGLIDTAVPKETQEKIVAVLDALARRENVEYHALRTRQSGMQKFVYVHVLVPGGWSVQQGHDLLERLEESIEREIANSIVFTHLEPLEDPASYDDNELVRQRTAKVEG